MPQIEAAEKAATGQKYKEVKNSTMADWEENEQLSPYVIFFMSWRYTVSNTDHTLYPIHCIIVTVKIIHCFVYCIV